MKIEHNFSLKNYNTFHIDCKAALFTSIDSAGEFINLMHTDERKHSHKKLFLGGGSNMLLTEERFHGFVIHNNILGKEVVSTMPGETFLKVGGGENRNDFVRWTIDQGLYGLENLVSIPGNVAAAPIQNIGAYGTDVGHAIISVGGISLKTGTYETVSHKECLFGYRDSIFKNELHEEFFITDVTFRLQHFDPDTYAPIAHYGNVSDELAKHNITKPTPRDIATAIAAIRAQKLPDPKQVGTAGSFFKNVILNKTEYEHFLEKLKLLKPDLTPEFYALDSEIYKIPTGWILDHALGYRGHRDGNVGCREHQALCLVNYGNATGQDIIRFAQKLQKECKEKLGVWIEPEVNFIG